MYKHFLMLVGVIFITFAAFAYLTHASTLSILRGNDFIGSTKATKDGFVLGVESHPPTSKAAGQ
jgi:hypothetical protein